MTIHCGIRYSPASFVSAICLIFFTIFFYFFFSNVPTTIVWVSISFFQFSTFVLYLHKLVLFYFDFCRLFSRVIFLSFCNHCYYWAECWYALCLLLFFVSYIFFSTSTNWGINCDDCSCSIRASSLEVFGQMTQLLKVSTIFLFSSIFF